MKKNRRGDYFFPVSALLGSIVLDGLTSHEKNQYVSLYGYLNKIYLSDDKNKICFFEEKSNYPDYPLGNAKIKDMVDALKNYLDFINGEQPDNKSTAIAFVSKMYKENAHAFNVFFFFFISFLYKRGINTDTIVKNELKNKIKEANAFFSEKNIAKAIGYLMDILCWDVGKKLITEGCGVSLGKLKKNLFEIIAESKGNIADTQGINIFLSQHLLYELVIRQDEAGKEKHLLNMIKYIDQCYNLVISGDFEEKTIRENNCYIINWDIYLELIERAFLNNDPKSITDFSKELCLLISKQFNTANTELLSFDKCQENYKYMALKIENTFKRYVLEKNDDFLSLTSLRTLFDSYTYILKLLSNNSVELKSIAINKSFLHSDLTEFQKIKLDEFIGSIELNIGKKTSIEKPLKGLLFKINSILGSGDYSINYINQHTEETNRIINGLLRTIKESYKEIHSKYHPSIFRYIQNFIADKIPPQEMILENLNDNTKIGFRVKSKQAKKLLKKYTPIIMVENGCVHIDLTYNGFSIDMLNDILNQLMMAYLAQKKIDTRSMETRLVYDSNKMIEKLSALTLPEKKLESEEGEIKIQNSRFDSALLFNSGLNSETNDATRNVAPQKREKIEHKSKKIKTRDVIKKEIELNELRKTQKEDKEMSAIDEAKQLFVSKKSTKEKPDHTHILNIVQDSRNRNFPVVIALNKKLSFKDSKKKNLSPMLQQAINHFVQDISFVVSKGQDGIKFCDGIGYVLKIRNLNQNSFRSVATVKNLESGAIVIQFDDVSNKTHADKAIRSARSRK